MNLISFNLFVLAVKKYNTFYSSLLRIRQIFNDATILKLLEHTAEIEEQAEKFLILSRMDWSDCGNLERHLNYLKHWLQKENRQACSSDLDDMIFYDLPQALDSLVKKAIDENELESYEPSQALPAERSISYVLQNFDALEIHVAWQKALNRKESDPEGAITISRTLLESVCKHILDEKGVEYDPNKADLPELYRKTAKELNLSPSQHTEEIFKQILGGCSGIVTGLGQLRNRLGDAHGQGKMNIRPAPRHAELAVNLSGSMALYLIETYKVSGR